MTVENRNPRPPAADQRRAAYRVPSPNHYGIYRAKTTGRLDAPGNNWSWRVMITRDHKALCNKSFSDKKYGGAEAALLAAIDYRDRLLERAHPAFKKDRNQLLRRNNTSGLAGVCRSAAKGRDYYVAQTLLPDGNRLRRAFSVAKYGDARARELAVAERAKQLAQVEGYAVLDPAALPPRVP